MLECTLPLRRQYLHVPDAFTVFYELYAKEDVVEVACWAQCRRGSFECAGKEPWIYLRDVLSLLPRWNARDVLQLAPSYWRDIVARLAIECVLVGYAVLGG